MTDQLVLWLKSTALSQAMSGSPYLWPLCETLHFIGLALLIGGAGIIDFRLMGFLRSIPLAAVMQLRRWAALGVLINTVTGALFFIGAPAQYIHNPAWYGKLLFLAVALINVAVFETRQGERVLKLAVDAEPPRSFKLAGAISITSWFLVLYFGRMLPFIGNAF